MPCLILVLVALAILGGLAFAAKAALVIVGAIAVLAIVLFIIGGLVMFKSL
jgi:hypothetical protein